MDARGLPPSAAVRRRLDPALPARRTLTLINPRQTRQRKCLSPYKTPRRNRLRLPRVECGRGRRNQRLLMSSRGVAVGTKTLERTARERVVRFGSERRGLRCVKK
eukprot:352329-Chlamydomonas_euryale.AAC.6